MMTATSAALIRMPITRSKLNTMASATPSREECAIVSPN